MNPVIFFKSLADDTRLMCLLLVHDQEELCVCELVHALGLSQPKISRHLAQLRQDEILLDRRQGKWVYYRINPQLPDWASVTLRHTYEGNTSYMASQLQSLMDMGDRPKRKAECC